MAESTTGPPRLAVSNIAWERAEDAAIASALPAEGCGGVELAPTKWRDAPLEAPAADVAAYRAWWEEHGLPVVAFQALLFGRADLQLFDSEQSRREMLDYLRRIIDLAQSFGAERLVFGSPKNRVRGVVPMAEALEIAVPFFQTLGEHAISRGTVLCIEANPPAYGCDFITSTAEAVDLCRRVDHPGFRVHGDLGGMALSGDDPADALVAAAPYLAHFHVSEPNLAELGTGTAQHARAGEALRAVKYSGWLSIEMRAVGEGNVEAVRRAVRVVKSQY